MGAQLLIVIAAYYKAGKASGLSRTSRLSFAEAATGAVSAVVLAAVERTWQMHGAWSKPACLIHVQLTAPRKRRKIMRVRSQRGWGLEGNMVCRSAFLLQAAIDRVACSLGTSERHVQLLAEAVHALNMRVYDAACRLVKRYCKQPKDMHALARAAATPSGPLASPGSNRKGTDILQEPQATTTRCIHAP